MSARFSLMRPQRNRFGIEEHVVLRSFDVADEGELLEALQDSVPWMRPGTSVVPQNEGALTMLLALSIAVRTP